MINFPRIKPGSDKPVYQLIDTKTSEVDATLEVYLNLLQSEDVYYYNLERQRFTSRIQK